METKTILKKQQFILNVYYFLLLCVFCDVLSVCFVRAIGSWCPKTRLIYIVCSFLSLKISSVIINKCRLFELILDKALRKVQLFVTAGLCDEAVSRLRSKEVKTRNAGKWTNRRDRILSRLKKTTLN